MAKMSREERFAKILMQECMDSKKDTVLKYVVLVDRDIRYYDYVKLRDILLDHGFNMYNMADAPRHFHAIEGTDFDHKYVVYKMLREELFAIDARRRIYDEGEEEILLPMEMRFQYCMMDLWYMLRRYCLNLIDPKFPEPYYHIQKLDMLSNLLYRV